MRRSFLRAGAAAALGLGPQLVDWSWLGSSGRGAHAQATLPAGRIAVLAENALWLLDAGGSRRRLAAGTGGWLQDPSWSPDGATLVYTHVQLRAGVGAAAPGGIPWPSGEVYAVRPGSPGAEPGLLLRREAPNETLVSAAWSPDGRSLYAVRRRPSATAPAFTSISDILRLDLGTGERSVISAPADSSELNVGPDGSLALIAETGPAVTGVRDTSLLRVLADGTVQELASTAPTAAVPSLGLVATPRFSPDGRKIAFIAGEGPAGAMAMAGAAGAGLPGNSQADRGVGRFAAQVIGTGPRAAQAHGAVGWPWVANLETGQLWRVPSGPHDDLTGLAWLPDDPAAPGMERLLLLDAQGIAAVRVADGALQRFVTPVNGATALAYRD
ncbi:MAG: hypothetical protein AVDCRST_MAG77-1595 [uncultured Chloroflexi bacterium]|uniref:TolB protein, periplasmic protein involved in the tonb-independent uptake of group A colicins n=1 Tax=uncultured Chloroflexota bacterium TaxID=166587 RepID=A0A6J4I4I1_9CHLR|nr:MAG: hypothetical protein AVDCRST_MAG77-1595 [uncultured Chloroflexota bacterium]